MTEYAFDDHAAMRPLSSPTRVECALRIISVVLLAVVAQLMAPVASSHHSFAMYDTKVMRTLTGRLVQFLPGANHAQLIFEVLEPDGDVSVDASGEPILWGVETGPAAQIARRGVTLDRFAVGTVITVNLNPLRDGRNFGALAREGGRLIHCGTQLPANGCTTQTGTVYLEDE
jgi:hypothetical protein